MSLTPTTIGTGNRLEEFLYNQDVFTSVGSGSWTHPNPGQALEVQVTLIGGGGGAGGAGESAGGDATSGSAGVDTTWDTDGSTVIATAGGGGAGGNDTANHGGAGGSSVTSPGLKGGNNSSTSPISEYNKIPGTPYGYGGAQGINSSYGGGQGGSGELKQFRQTVTGNINFIIGAGGSGGAGTGANPNIEGEAGGDGVVYVSYAKAATGIPSPLTYKFEEEWLDYDSTVSGSGTWVHPKPGTAIEMTVIAVGGAGGYADNGVAGGNGGSTTFDSVTANGGEGGGASTNSYNGGVSTSARPTSNLVTDGSSALLHTGFGTFGLAQPTEVTGILSGLYAGASGYTKISRITVTGNINYTVGDGGTGGGFAGDSHTGGIILKYSRPV